MKNKGPLSTGTEWTFELIDQYDTEIARIAKNFGLDTYPNQIEVISAEQMMDAYASSGMPIGYHHWSYGKHFMETEKNYRRGRMGLAYEIVINSNPCISYLMEENTMLMQALVIAHAAYGHNSFFKNNYLFQQWTSADSIIDYLVFAKNYVKDCEKKYGVDAVEAILDSCHALMNFGVDRYKRPQKISMKEEQNRQKERENHLQYLINELWRTIPNYNNANDKPAEFRFPQDPQENILYFIEKNAPLLEPWQREIIRIVRKISQYFYPQKQTKIMNEGWATFWHYTILNQMYDEQLIPDGYMMEFLQSHTNVIKQPEFDSPYYNGINPYALGFAMVSDIRRISENPDDEDREWFPELVGKDWLENLDFAMRNFKDESFISQYLSPRVIRQFKLFALNDDDKDSHIEIDAIHNTNGYSRVREILADQNNLGSLEPNIQVYNVDVRGDRSLTLRHYQYNRKPLGSSLDEVLRHMTRLWGFDVRLETVDEKGNVTLTSECQAANR